MIFDRVEIFLVLSAANVFLPSPVLFYHIFRERELEVGEYQALTPKEERDLDSLMVKYKFAISNAEAFTEQLNRELANIDATNVHAIMESEKKVEALMTMFDVSVTNNLSSLVGQSLS